MAGIAHAAIGLAAKPLLPEVNVGWLILGTVVLDILWLAFWCVGLETSPMNPASHPPWWDHSLLMAVIWSVLFGLLASWLARRFPRRTLIGVVFGLMVFSHWVLDWITHPMTALSPTDKGIPLAFQLASRRPGPLPDHHSRLGHRDRRTSCRSGVLHRVASAEKEAGACCRAGLRRDSRAWVAYDLG